MSFNTNDNQNIPNWYGIHSYKHNGNIHRIWERNRFLHYKQGVLIGGNLNTFVAESDGQNWFTRPAVTFFYPNRWFNIIGMKKKEGIQFYCNMSSPYVINEGALKYIDYDLDVKVFPDFSYEILDYEEFLENLDKMHYPPKLVYLLQVELKELLEMIDNKQGPFKPGVVEYWLKKLETKWNQK